MGPIRAICPTSCPPPCHHPCRHLLTASTPPTASTSRPSPSTPSARWAQLGIWTATSVAPLASLLLTTAPTAVAPRPPLPPPPPPCHHPYHHLLIKSTPPTAATSRPSPSTPSANWAQSSPLPTVTACNPTPAPTAPPNHSPPSRPHMRPPSHTSAWPPCPRRFHRPRLRHRHRHPCQSAPSAAEQSAMLVNSCASSRT